MERRSFMFDFTDTLERLEALRNEINSVFNNSYSMNSSYPLVNVYETEDDFKIVAELPGVTKDALNLTFTGNILTLSGRREGKKYGEKISTLRKERLEGDFSKSLRIPVAVKSDEITANFNDGILTVVLPKSEEAKPKRIAIQA